MTPTTQEPGFGIYVHWPFCAQKCPYCDFNSHVRHGGWDEARFLAAYKRELSFVAGMISPPPCGEGSGVGGSPTAIEWGCPPPWPSPTRGEGKTGIPRTVSSIFFGGGTPSLMKPETVAAIIDRIAALWPIDDDAEITLEANPGSVEAARFKGYRTAGVNRVSIGVQSLKDEELKKLGRIHTAAEARAALEVAALSFDRFSFDLIYARPAQTASAWHAELAEALALAGNHLSLYQLTIEAGTPYAALHAAGKLAVPDPDTARALYEITQELTETRGLPAYEISNHAAPGEESRHNLLYWRYGEYAGIGPGAHGRLLLDGRRHATVAEGNPEAWAERIETKGSGVTGITPLSRAEQADEMLLMGLRLSEGLDLDRLAHTTGTRPDPRALHDLESRGLVERFPATSPLPVGKTPLTPRNAGGAVEGANNSRDTTPPHPALRADLSPLGRGENHPDDIPACVGPGRAPTALCPHSLGRLRATPCGRFVLNALVVRLAAALEPVELT